MQTKEWSMCQQPELRGIGRLGVDFSLPEHSDYPRPISGTVTPGGKSI